MEKAAEMKKESKLEIANVAIDKEALNKSYPEVDYLGEQKVTDQDTNNLNLVIIGHVDSGKSTMTGHLLYKLGLVNNTEMRRNEKLTEVHNKAGFEFAYVMDETDEERERGVTIEVTTRYFSTDNRNFTILDAPGHRDFVANMITGAAQANCGILCIDSMTTQFERGWIGYQGTTKEHAILARSLGVNQLIVAINKLEKL